eukprot:1175341-Prorocentrum_minimum.AAC.4
MAFIQTNTKEDGLYTDKHKGGWPLYGQTHAMKDAKGIQTKTSEQFMIVLLWRMGLPCLNSF